MKNNPRHEHFAREYVACGCNATKAYRVAYPASLHWAENVASKRACELLRRGEVLGRIKEIQDDLAKQTGVATRREVEEILSRILRARVSDVLAEDGTINIAKLRRCQHELGEVTVADTVHGRNIKVKFRDTIAAADRLSKMLGWDKPVQTQDVTNLAAQRAAFQAMSKEDLEAWLRDNAQ